MRSASRSWWEQAVQNRLVALVLAMIVCVPLIATPANSRVHGLSTYVFEGFAIILLATLAWRAKWDLRRDKVVSFLTTGPNAVILLYGTLVVASALLTPQRLSGVQEALRIVSGILLYFVVAYQFRRSEHLSKLIETLIAVGIVAAVWGFAQYSSGAQVRASGLFGNPQLLASFLVILLPVIAVFALRDTNEKRQLAAMVATLLMGACLMISQTRSAWVAAVVASVVVCGLAVMASLRDRQNRKPAGNRAALALPLLLVATTFGLFMLMWPQTQQILDRGATLANAGNERTLQTRNKLSAGAWRITLDNPLSGIGVGNYGWATADASVYGRILDRNTPPSLAENAHNLYLQTAAEMGFPGLILLVSIPLAFVVCAGRRIATLDPGLRRSLLIGCTGAIVGFMVDAVASPSWQLGQNAMFFWLVLGLGVSVMRPVAKASREEAAAPVQPRRALQFAAAAASLGLMGLLPTASLAVGDGYPDHITIAPKTSTIVGGQSQAYTVKLFYTDGSSVDVTLSPKTTYTENGLGAMAGLNKSAYQSKLRKKETVTVTAQYNDGSFNDTDDATLTVN